MYHHLFDIAQYLFMHIHILFVYAFDMQKVAGNIYSLFHRFAFVLD